MPLPDPHTFLQAIHATIAGVTTADQAWAIRGNASDLPQVMTEPGPASWGKHDTGATKGWNYVARQITVTVLVKPLGLGQGQDEGFQAVLPLLVQFGARYVSDITLQGNANKIDQITDSGAIVVKGPAGQEYWGFVFKFRLQQIFTTADLSIAATPKLAHAHVTGTLFTNVPPPNP